MNNYYVVNLENVKTNKNHPYTLTFKGYIPTFGQTTKLYTFKYDGSISFTDADMPESVKIDFAKQLSEDYGSGRKFKEKEVKEQLKKKNQYKMQI